MSSSEVSSPRVRDDYSSTFTFENFSTDLLVECVLQQLDTMTVQKPYISNTSTGHTWDDVRKWVRLTETLLQCLKLDVKNMKTKSTNGVYDRAIAASIVSQWFPDLQEIRTVYLQKIATDDKVQKEVEVLFSQVDTLYNLSIFVYRRDVVRASDDTHKREEVVFVYDDASSI